VEHLDFRAVGSIAQAVGAFIEAIGGAVPWSVLGAGRSQNGHSPTGSNRERQWRPDFVAPAKPAEESGGERSDAHVITQAAEELRAPVAGPACQSRFGNRIRFSLP